MAAAAAAADDFAVVTWNLQNYLAADRVVAGVWRPGYPKPEAEKAAVRRVLRAIDADVVALQEIGGEALLEELRRDLAREGLDYPHRAWLAGPDPDRRLAVLSRRALRRVAEHAELSFRYLGGTERVKRGVLEVAVAAGAGELTLFVVHLKSRYTDRKDDPQSAIRRAGEAVAVRDLVLARVPDPSATPFLLLGDLNDSPRSRPLRALQERGRTRIAVILPAEDDRGDAWTHRQRDEEVYSRVDYILASPAALPWVPDGRAAVFDAPDVRTASDHRPVVVRVRTP